MAKGVTIRMWRRSLFILITLGLCFAIIILRLSQLQIIQNRNLQNMALDQQLKDTIINPKRGTIYDRNFKILAQSATVWTVVLEPAYIKSDSTKELISSGLSGILEMDKDEILKFANKKSYYVILKRKVENETKNKVLDFIKENKLRSGIKLIEDYRRYYKNGRFLASTLGFTGQDGQGLAGLENYYDKDLTGEPGRLLTAKNAVGSDMPFEHEQKISPKSGNSLVLSIDENIQYIMEKYLEEGRINGNVLNGAAAVMMDVNTGEVLGMATKDDFDLNQPFEIVNEELKKQIDSLPKGEERSNLRNTAQQQQWRNKSVSDTYMPGSTYKILTSSMGLEEAIVNEETPFFCSGSIVPFKGARPIHCHKHSGHGAQNFTEAVCHSCNPAFVMLGQNLGAERFYKYFKNFGLTQKTGIDLPGEANGIFFSKDGSMAPMDLAVASFGQNFSITPIQMITAVASVANGGELITPHIGKQIIDDDNSIIKVIGESPKRRVISQETCKRISAILQKNVESGSGKNGYVAGYRICGKTGTSEKIGQSAPGSKDYIASFCCFAPAEAPKVALLVIYDTPKGQSYYGSQVAAPYAAKMMNEILPYLGIEKKYNEQELEKLDIDTPELIGLSTQEAVQKLQALSLSPRINGSGQTITHQIPEQGSKIPKGGTVVLYTEGKGTKSKVRVPNLIGLTASAANKAASANRLNIKIKGAISSDSEMISCSQSVDEGTEVIEGTVITLEFIKKDTVN